MKKSVSLILGSGGARGLAHVGVIKYLEENNYEIKSISGSSIGALIGGFYAAGKLDTYVKWLEKLDLLDMLKLLDFKGVGGFVSGDTLLQELENLVGDYNIEELDIKFTAVATDLNAQKEIWLTKGSLLSAIRASISLPMFFTPYLYNGKLLVDGGVLNPVPIAPTFGDATDLSIAVNLGGKPCNGCLEKDVEIKQKKFKEYITKKLSIPNTFTSKNNIYFVANRSFEVMQNNLTKMKLAAYSADVEIEIPSDLCGTFEFIQAKKVIDYGYNASKNILDNKQKL